MSSLMTCRRQRTDRYPLRIALYHIDRYRKLKSMQTTQEQLLQSIATQLESIKPLISQELTADPECFKKSPQVCYAQQYLFGNYYQAQSHYETAKIKAHDQMRKADVEYSYIANS